LPEECPCLVGQAKHGKDIGEAVVGKADYLARLLIAVARLEVPRDGREIVDLPSFVQRSCPTSGRPAENLEPRHRYHNLGQVVRLFDNSFPDVFSMLGLANQQADSSGKTE